MTIPLRLLFIDDHADDVREMERLIANDGFAVTALTVTNLRDLRRALSTHWDLAICEERLAGCTGQEALHVIHASAPDLAVVMVSRVMSEDTIIALLKAGAQNCLGKERLLLLGPLVRRELQDAVQRRRNREAERALRESEERFRLLADQAFDVIWATDLDLRLTFIGNAVRRHLGMAPHELLGRSLLDLLPPEGRQRLGELHGFYRSAANHDPHYPPFLTELEMLHRDGRRVVVEVSAMFLRDERGRPTGLQGISRDITMRRTMERDQTEQRQELAAIVSRVPSLLLVMNGERRIHKVAGAVSDLLGHKVEGMLGRRCGDALGCAHTSEHPGQCGEGPTCNGCHLGRIVNSVMANGREEARREVVISLMRDGQPRALTMVVSAAPLQICGGRMVLLSLTDITEERLRESRLRLFSAAVEQSSNGILILDLDRRITFANARLTHLTGQSADELLGQPLHALFAADPLLYLDQDIWSQVDARHFWEGDLSLRAPDGTTCWVRATVNPIRDAAGVITHHVVIASDISELLKIQEEAHQHRQRLMHADKMMALGTLVAGVAHEVNNPASFISLNTPLLEDTWKDTLPILDRHAAEQGDFMLGGLPYSEMRGQVPHIFTGIRDGLSRIRTIVGDLKDFSRQGPAEASQAVDVNAVVRAAASLLAGNVRKATTRFTVTAQADLPRVTGHFQKLEQVVINLVQNACEALTAMGQAITVSTRYDADRQQVLLEIADEGAGMSEDLLPRITEPFFTTRARHGGTGLGLSIVAAIIKDHHGDLEFSSAPGKGTQVTVRLPVN